MTNSQFATWQTKRRNRLMHLRRQRKLKRDPKLQKVANHKRVERRRRNDPDNLARKRWYQEHRQEEIDKAMARKSAAKARARAQEALITQGDPQ